MMIRYSDSSFTWFSHGTKKTPNWLGPSMAEPRKIMDFHLAPARYVSMIPLIRNKNSTSLWL